MDVMTDEGIVTPGAAGGAQRGADYDVVENTPEKERIHVQQICATIDGDLKFHKEAFAQMREDMVVARYGYSPKDGWSEEKYSANIIGQHVQRKAAILYAKNPKATARRRETLDFAVWDETPESLMLAYQTVQMVMLAAQTAMTAPPMIDPMTGMAAPPQVPPVPGAEEAMALMQDFQQGMQRRTTAKRIGRTLEVLFGWTMREQRPIEFKAAMKKQVRRALTCGVAYVELQIERQYGSDPAISARLMDTQSRLAHLSKLIDDLEAGEIEDASAEMAELELMIAELQQAPERVEREGIIYDFPRSLDVIPDRLCRDLVGFEGARHVTVKQLMTKRQIEELFQVDLGTAYRSYKPSGVADDDDSFRTTTVTADGVKQSTKGELCCLYRHFDRVSGQVYHVVDGYPRYLRPPAPPDVKVEGFFPIYALVFNEAETEKHLFPPSDVWLLRHAQKEYNRSRDGKREHRKNARPRFASAKSVLDEGSRAALRDAEPFSVAELNLPPDMNVGDVLQPIPVPGVDPNLYDVNEIFGDMQIIAGTQQAQLGGLAKVTATETAVAADANMSAAQADVDNLDLFLTRLARDTGQVMLAELSPETVARVAGPGGLWPDMTMQLIQEEIMLEVEAGSSGSPNAAVEIANWERLLPSLLQMPSIDPIWLARESLKRLDDRMDLTEALVANLPAIVAQNRMAQPMTNPDPGANPTDQGQEGGDGNATPEGASGTQAAMGGNNAPVENAVA